MYQVIWSVRCYQALQKWSCFFNRWPLSCNELVDLLLKPSSIWIYAVRVWSTLSYQLYTISDSHRKHLLEKTDFISVLFQMTNSRYFRVTTNLHNLVHRHINIEWIYSDHRLDIGTVHMDDRHLCVYVCISNDRIILEIFGQIAGWAGHNHLQEQFAKINLWYIVRWHAHDSV